jgi:hypothetical protein
MILACEAYLFQHVPTNLCQLGTDAAAASHSLSASFPPQQQQLQLLLPPLPHRQQRQLQSQPLMHTFDSQDSTHLLVTATAATVACLRLTKTAHTDYHGVIWHADSAIVQR